MSSDARPVRSKQIGRYRVIDRLGKGAMGIVYSAVDDVMGRQVAVKVMMEDIETDPDTRTRFYREAKIAGQLMHNHIVTVFDLGEEDGRPYIVMELLRGSTLGDYLSHPAAVPLETKLELMIQVCEGLAVAHARHIFHRDIKPSNLFVQTDGSLKILDFGIARLASSTMTANGLVVGTPHFMSPEQARGVEVDARSDIFSAGAVFYFMLAGQRPFAAPSLPAAMHRVQFDAPSPVPSGIVPAALERLIMKTLAKDRAMRHQTILDLRDELVAFRRSFDVETRRLAQSVADRCRAFDAVCADVQAARIEAGLDAPGVSPEIGAARQRLAVLEVDSAGALLVVPFKRDELNGLIPVLTLEHQVALARLLAWQGALDAVRMARDTLVSEGPHLALLLFDAAVRAAPESGAFQAERERCVAAVRKLDVVDAHVGADGCAGRDVRGSGGAAGNG